MPSIARVTIEPISARLLVQHGGGGFFQHFLVFFARSSRARPNAPHYRGCRKRPEFQYGVAEIFFNIDGIITKGGLGLAARFGKGFGIWLSSWAIFIPRPPPPEAALTRTGKPISRPSFRAMSTSRPRRQSRNNRIPNSVFRLAAIYRPSADMVGFRVDKSQAMRVNIGKTGIFRQKP